ncbi:serine/threonine-protein kinase [Nocardioides caldifontis]|uniref:serine/threonine-protein kinase n=1 Tax=Nocardioides caldifontis TaxID=2588938 RepID=UPI001396C520|nr:serine/threonine-protein kinase [Nocardioides caldifontis]
MIAGRYALKDEVGRGGMGVVWRAEDELLGRDVAVKRVGLTPGGATPDLARAAREARLAATLNHPNVVAVFDLVDQDDQQWLVMEYVESRTLTQLVAEHGPLSPDDAARLLCQAADALVAAHRAGITHRDVKPSNILITSTGRAKLTDFGIARAAADATLTQTGMMTGSPAYLAPEVASGQTAGPHSDVWALGATAYHALTGKPPFETGENVLGTLWRIVQEEPPRPDDAGWLAPLFEHTMVKDVDARWSMEEVADFLARGAGTTTSGGLGSATAEDVEPVQEDGRTQTVPVATGVPPAPVPPVRRRRRWALAALGLAAALLVVLGVAAWNWLDTEPVGTDRARDDSSQDSAEPGPSQEPRPARPTAKGMRTFVEDYLATAPVDQTEAFTMLTSEFQTESGGLEGYRGFWSKVASAQPVDVQVDPRSLEVRYTVEYAMKDGNEFTDVVELVLAHRDGEYRIAAEPTR